MRARLEQALRNGTVPFVGVTLVALAFVPLFEFDARELVAAVLLAAAAGIAVVALPWRLLPAWATDALPLIAFAVIALLRDATGGASSSYTGLLFVPVLWVALHGTRRALLLTLGGMVVTLLLPALVVAGDRYPADEWRRTVIWAVLGTLTGTAVHGLLTETRARSREARESEERLRLVLETSHDAFIAIDEVGVVVEWSGPAAALFGCPRDEVVGRPLDGRMLPLRHAAQLERDRVRERGEGAAFGGIQEVAACRRDGSEFTAELSIARRPDGDGYNAFVRDVSERRQARHEAELQSAVSHVLADAPDVEDALYGVLEVLGEDGGWRFGAGWLARPGEDVLRCRSTWRARGSEAPQFSAVTAAATVTPGEGVVGRVWQSRESEYSDDVTADPTFLRTREAVADDLRRGVWLPLVADGRAFGVLELCGGDDRAPEARMLRALAEISVRVAQFLHRREADQAVERERDYTRALVAAIDDGIIVHDADLAIVEVSERFELLTGWSREEIVGLRPPFPWWRPEDADWLVEVMRDGVARGVRSETDAMYVRRDGQPFSALVARNPVLADGSTVRYIVTFKDVTDRRRAEAAVRESEQRFRAFATQAPVGIFEADAEGRCSFVNARWCELTGMTADEARERSWLGRVHPDDADGVGFAWDAAVGAGIGFHLIFRFGDGVGEPVWVSVGATPLDDGDDSELTYLGTVTDITVQRAVEDELRRERAALDAAQAELETMLGEVTSRSAMLEFANIELEAARAAADHLASVDPLTGVANRREMSAELAERAGAPGALGLIMLDVDRFKHINDAYGHAAGDSVLGAVADRIRDAVREGDPVGRWGGEEFLVLVPDAPDEQALLRVAEAIRRAIEAEPVEVSDGSLAVTASLGVALGEPGALDVERLVHCADIAMYAAKRRGRNQVRLHSALSERDLAAEEPEAIRIAQTIAQVVAIREGMPEPHAEQVADLAARSAERMGLPAPVVLRCRLGGLLHDIGKVAIPDRVLAKPSPLDAEEWELMRKHPLLGARLVLRLPGLAHAEEAVLHHHERFDGSGYPDGLAGEDIPIEARVVAAADCFSAMTANRAYASGRSYEHALSELAAAAGTQLDPAVVEALRATVLEDARRAGERLASRRADADADAA